jgi:hypothetical protein
MSATGRGTTRNPADLYPTPKDAFAPLIPYIPREGQVWEPAWGDARLVRWMLESGIDAWGTDLSNPEFPVNFLMDSTERYCTLTNPPFSCAFEFCQNAVAHSQHVFMLLRLAFLASMERRDWFRKHEPSCLFVLSKRPSFVMSVTCAVKCGYKKLIPIESPRPSACPTCGRPVKVSTSDSADYAWFMWSIDPKAPKGIIHL